jgi:hypothetical protein
VAKPGGIIAVKDFDATLTQFLPLDPGIMVRLAAARRAKAAGDGPLETGCGPLLRALFRRAGLTDIVRKSWLVERWAPPPPATRQFVSLGLRRVAELAVEHELPRADCETLRAAENRRPCLMTRTSATARPSWSRWGVFPIKGVSFYGSIPKGEGRALSDWGITGVVVQSPFSTALPHLPQPSAPMPPGIPVALRLARICPAVHPASPLPVHSRRLAVRSRGGSGQGSAASGSGTGSTSCRSADRPYASTGFFSDDGCKRRAKRSRQRESARTAAPCLNNRTGCPPTSPVRFSFGA